MLVVQSSSDLIINPDHKPKTRSSDLLYFTDSKLKQMLNLNWWWLISTVTTTAWHYWQIKIIIIKWWCPRETQTVHAPINIRQQNSNPWASIRFCSPVNTADMLTTNHVSIRVLSSVQPSTISKQQQKNSNDDHVCFPCIKCTQNANCLDDRQATGVQFHHNHHCRVQENHKPSLVWPGTWCSSVVHALSSPLYNGVTDDLTSCTWFK